MVFEVLLSALLERVGSAVVGVSETCSRLRIAHNAIHKVHQPSMNM
jgi:hypothetical protein